MNKKRPALFFICIWVSIGIISYLFFWGLSGAFEDNNSISYFIELSTNKSIIYSSLTGLVIAVAVFLVLQFRCWIPGNMLKICHKNILTIYESIMNNKILALIFICIWVGAGLVEYYLFGGNAATFEENNAVEYFTATGCVFISSLEGLMDVVAVSPILLLIRGFISFISKRVEVHNTIESCQDSCVSQNKACEGIINRKTLELLFSCLWICIGIISYFWGSSEFNHSNPTLELKTLLNNMVYSSLTGLVVAVPVFLIVLFICDIPGNIFRK